MEKKPQNPLEVSSPAFAARTVDEARRFREIANSAPALIYELDATGKPTFINKQLREFHGFSLEELRKMELGEVLHPEDRERSTEEFLAALQERKAVTTEFRLKAVASGEYRWFRNTAVPRFSGDDEFLGYVGACVDITETREAENQIKFQAWALSQVNDAVIATDNDGAITYWNDGARRLYGFTMAEVIGQQLKEINQYGWQSETHQRGALESLKRDGRWRGESIHTKKTGEKFRTDSTVSVLKDENGNSVGLLAVVRDITDNRRVEEAFQTSEERFRVQFKGTPVPIFSWQRIEDDFVLIDFNDAAATMTGNKIADLLGRRASEVYRENVQVIELLQNCYRTRSTIRIDGEFRLITTGELKYLDVSFIFLRPDLVLVHTEDITERKRAEAALREAERKYRDIFENATEGIFQTTPDGKFIEANPAMSLMLGFECPEQLMGERTDLQQAYVDKSRRAELKELLAKGGVVRNFEYESFRRDGSKLWLSENVRAVRNQAGEMLYYEGTAKDITDQKNAEARSTTLATLAQKLSGARIPVEAAQIIVDTAGQLFGWDACTLELYDSEANLVRPILRMDTIDGHLVDVVPEVSATTPSERHRRTISEGADLILRKEPVAFDQDSMPFGDKSRPSASLMSVPIRHSSHVIGVLSIQSYQKDFYNEASLAGLQALADLCGEALNRIKVEESLAAERRRSQEALQKFSQRLIEAQEAERQRIARELHDEIGQVLTALRLNLQAAQAACGSEGCLPYLVENKAMVDEALRLVRDLSFELRPSLLDDLGLVAALRWYVDRYAARGGLHAEVIADSMEAESRVPRKIETAAFRIAQEALTNVVRHAEAQKVIIELQHVAGELVVKIKDNGVGFDLPAILRNAAPTATLGLRGMEERAIALGGKLEINSDVNKGTEIRALLPVPRMKRAYR